MPRKQLLVMVVTGLLVLKPTLGSSQSATPAAALDQQRTLRVITADSQPIAHATVSLDGGMTQVTDDKGEINLGKGKTQTFTARVTRIGYGPWFGKLEIPDSAGVLFITLPRLTQTLAATVVSGRANKAPLEAAGFYDRWEMRQKGMLTAVFISPEELEFRHPDKTTAILYGLSGVQITNACVVPPPNPRQSCVMGQVAFSAGRRGCPMAIVIDGMQQRPNGPNIDLNTLLQAGDVNAVEVYARGGNMPVKFQFQDTACGVIAFWTGSRKP